MEGNSQVGEAFLISAAKVANRLSPSRPDFSNRVTALCYSPQAMHPLF